MVGENITGRCRFSTRSRFERSVHRCRKWVFGLDSAVSVHASCASNQHGWSLNYVPDASRRARELAEDAFFQPSFMSLLYFPLEHHLAIYTVRCLQTLFVPPFRKLLSNIFLGFLHEAVCPFRCIGINVVVGTGQPFFVPVLLHVFTAAVKEVARRRRRSRTAE